MFRFTVRDVLWLMVVVGVCCAWGLHVREINSRHLRYLEDIDQRLLNDAKKAQQDVDEICSASHEVAQTAS
jgi:hypothetical protein